LKEYFYGIGVLGFDPMNFSFVFKNKALDNK